MRFSCTSVHPRACGEHGLGGGKGVKKVGSSPRMRGTQRAAGPHHWRPRFIPAHAGNTSPPRTDLPRSPVHPRACGEHKSNVVGHTGIAGSSPRMRGTLPFILGRCGISSVHPRACGEHLLVYDELLDRGGSSPRMRGTQEVALLREGVDRFIPAHAGNTILATSRA